MSKRVAMAIAAHPDDIEMMMAGTLALLGRAGYELHMMNIANGCCGSMLEEPEKIAARRWREAQDAASVLGATLHPPVANDMEVFFSEGLLRKVAAAVRKAEPNILLIQPPQDYMEDHMNSCRLALTAAFARGMPNFETDPPEAPVAGDVTVYHALPWGFQDPYGYTGHATHYVDISSTIDLKREALAAHVSQKEWLDQTQGLGSYLSTMVDVCTRAGRMSGKYPAAEGWQKHLHFGYCAEEADPLQETLGDLCMRNKYPQKT